MALDEIVDDVRLFHRVQRQEVGAERRAVLARLVPRRVEVGEAVAGAPPADADELVRTARVSRPDAPVPAAAAAAGSHAARCCLARLHRRHRLRHLPHVGPDLAHVTQRTDRQLLHHLHQLRFERFELPDRRHGRCVVVVGCLRDAVVTDLHASHHVTHPSSLCTSCLEQTGLLRHFGTTSPKHIGYR